ncbi:hypothetical protein MTR_5g063315 [Medicago truncatula]|uniref:Uncharacterized protein n=1 Tax=Medicago truncatula TaxID=3880 RepID=A0A072UQD7_MEDTR|nr:hypothetical protein MTR_5g063315 [Medicago truncatula]
MDGWGVLVARYGDEDVRLIVGGQSGSSWWREVAKICDGVGVDIGGWFEECVAIKSVSNCIENRLSCWKSRFLSFGGRLLLLKYIVTSMAIYDLSFFQAPSGGWEVGGWGQSGSSWWRETVKICDGVGVDIGGWIEECVARKECEGLRVREMREFNPALLGKWYWRMLVNRVGFLYRVLVARYGEEDGRLVGGGRSGSFWWREVAKICDGVGVDIGGWFEECVARNVGDGVDTYFGLSIDCVLRRLVFWESVLNRIKNRMSGWKSRFLSFGGRLILLNM